MSNGLDPNQAQKNVQPDLGPNCLQIISADDTGRDRVNMWGLTHEAPNTTTVEFVNTVDPDETSHYEPSHLDLQCLPSSL